MSGVSKAPDTQTGRELNSLDFVLLTQAHADHVDIPLWQRLRKSNCTWIVKTEGEPTAYFAMPESHKNDTCRLDEYGGSMQSVLNGMAMATAGQPGLSNIRLRTYKHETTERKALEKAGARFEGYRQAGGTLRLINIENLMNELLPYTKEIVGSRVADKLRFSAESNEHYTISMFVRSRIIRLIHPASSAASR